MRKLYALMALVIIAIIAVNIVVLYIMFTRPDAARIQQMIDASIKPTKQIDSAQLSEIAKLVPTPPPAPTASPVPGPKGDTVIGASGTAGQSIVGPSGKDGKDGLSIIGPKGDTGSPGREIQLARDPSTGELYMKYTGDTLWSLVEPTTP